MKSLILNLAVLITLTGLLSGCSERIEPKPVTYSQLLTGTEKKAWRLVSYQEIDEGQAYPVVGVQQYVTQVLGANLCLADLQYVFYANEEHRYEVLQGANKCNAQLPDVLITDTWALVNSNATLEFFFPLVTDQAYPFVIKNLTDRVLTIELYYQDINVSERYTFNAVTTK
ncbi:hypothetical protein GCM10023187_10920 [Nibrella viscosa]|uniref:Lipoprotein n=1 Tax=Nibrella viscosa TaxID=1084524 RepID=A0ABP8K202_9BACT